MTHGQVAGIAQSACAAAHCKSSPTHLHNGDNGAFHKAARAGPALGSTQAGYGLVHLHLLPGPDLNPKFHTTIAANMSPVYYTSRLKLCVPDSRWPAFSPTGEPSGVPLASIPGWPSVNALSYTRPKLSPEISGSVNSPNVIRMVMWHNSYLAGCVLSPSHLVHTYLPIKQH